MAVEAIKQPTLGLNFTPTTVGVLERGREDPSSVLTPVFAGEVYSVTSAFPQDTLVASLVAYSSEKRQIIAQELDGILKIKRQSYETAVARRKAEDVLRSVEEMREIERRLVLVGELPPSPDSWQGFMAGLLAQQKRALMAALGSTLGEGRRFYGWRGLESRRTVEDLRQIEVSPDFVPTRKVDLRNVWISLAFRGS